MRQFDPHTIVEAAVAEYLGARVYHESETRTAVRAGVRQLVARIGLYREFSAALEARRAPDNILAPITGPVCASCGGSGRVLARSGFNLSAVVCTACSGSGRPCR